MIKELSAYYQQNDISALEFRCRHLPACCNGNKRFVEAKEAFVGTEYEKGTLPRLLFVSLDPGASRKNPEDRTLEFVRWFEEHERDVDKLPKARHWYRTHELTWMLLKKIKPDLQIKDSQLYFAHVNSVKCCVGNADHKSASPVLFKNCRNYVAGEVAVLKPDILVTQGRWAKFAIQQSFDAPQCPGDIGLCSHVRLLIGNRSVLWLHTNHPRDYGRFNQQRRECFEKWAKIIHDKYSK